MNAEDRAEETIILDPPGQPELTIHHMALPNILQKLEKAGYRVRLQKHHERSLLEDAC